MSRQIERPRWHNKALALLQARPIPLELGGDHSTARGALETRAPRYVRRYKGPREYRWRRVAFGASRRQVRQQPRQPRIPSSRPAPSDCRGAVAKVL